MASYPDPDRHSQYLTRTTQRFEVHHRDVSLSRTSVLGRGAYGFVCKAKCHELPCAAKLLHPIFFSFEGTANGMLLERFHQECDVLQAIRHPCIVQFLGTHRDTETGALALLMELMDESLTAFLERSQATVAYHLQVTIAHDIALALSYLHNNDIVHRDLSSNNVLMLAGVKAKVTDLGMAKLIDVAAERVTPLTECPGTLVYMSPESLRIPPVYSQSLDVFSLGVLTIQIITRNFPHPTDAKRTVRVEDPTNPSGAIEVPVGEKERRQDDIDLIDPDHPLLKIVFSCLHDRDIQRPTALDVCHHLSEMKRLPQFIESERQTNERVASVYRLEDELETSRLEEARLRDVIEEQRRQIEDLGVQREAELKEKEDEIAGLRQELESRRGQELEAMRSFSPREDRSPGPGSVATYPPRRSRVPSPSPYPAPPISEEWYHGLIDRMTACRRLQQAGAPGAFLFRQSASEQGLVLSFLDQSDTIHHFKIEYCEGRYNIGGRTWFDSLADLVDYHTNFSSVLDHHSEKLKYGIPRPE